MGCVLSIGRSAWTKIVEACSQRSDSSKGEDPMIGNSVQGGSELHHNNQLPYGPYRGPQDVASELPDNSQQRFSSRAPEFRTPERFDHTEGQLPDALVPDRGQTYLNTQDLRPTYEVQPSPTSEASRRRPSGSSIRSITSVYKDEVLSLIKALQSAVGSFVKANYRVDDEIEQSSTRERVYRPVIAHIDAGEYGQSARDHNILANEIIKRLRDTPRLEGTPSRTNSDLFKIWETANNLKEKIAHDKGSWKFDWDTHEQDLEFPRAKRDGQCLDPGVTRRGESGRC